MIYLIFIYFIINFYVAHLSTQIISKEEDQTPTLWFFTVFISVFFGTLFVIKGIFQKLFTK